MAEFEHIYKYKNTDSPPPTLCIDKKCTKFVITNNEPIKTGSLTLKTFFLQELPPIADGCLTLIANNNRIRKILDLPKTLRKISLKRNYIQYYNYDSFGPNLREFNIAHNFINDLPFAPPSLETLIVSDNAISYLPLLPDNLKTLKASKCKLTNLPPFPRSLEYISVRNNNIQVIEDDLMNCRDLRDLKYEGNPNIRLSERLLEHIDNHFAAMREEVVDIDARNNYELPDTRTIYNDGQNVHNSKITKQIIEFIDYMKKTPIQIKEKGGIMAEVRTKLKNYNILQYICNTNSVHSILKLSFSDLFYIYYNHIYDKKYKDEALKILDEDLMEMRYICFTGRVSRLVNTLSGLDDGINVGISETEQIQAKFLQVKKLLEPLKTQAPPLYQLSFIIKFKEYMKEIEVEDEVIEVWLEPLIDELKDAFENLSKNKCENDIKKLYNLPLVLRKEIYKYIDPNEYGFENLIKSNDIKSNDIKIV